MLAIALGAVGVASAAGLALTDAPPVAIGVLAPVAIVWGAILGRREWRRRPDPVVLRSDGSVSVGTVAADAFHIAWQGPLTTFEWSVAGRRERRVAWPDVVDAAVRRELRLWTLGRAVRASTAAVAP